MALYKSVVRPLLFKIDPETAHGMTMWGLELPQDLGLTSLTEKLLCYEDKRLEIELFGIKFRNPLGLSAGFDKNAGVRIELGKEATRELIKGENPDVIIFATGARPYIPNIPGFESQKVCTAWDVLNGKTAAGHEVIVIGGGNVGLETAEYLAEKGKRVTVVEKLSEVGVDVEPTNRKLLLERLKDYGVEILTKVNVIDITDHGTVFLWDKIKRPSMWEP